MRENTESIAAQGNEMGTLPVGRLLREMSVPLIFSMFVQVLYGLVDSMYVARLGDAALTAISLSMPVQYLVLGVGIGIGVGVNSVLSQKLGEQDAAGVDRAAGNGFILVWIMSVDTIILGYPNWWGTMPMPVFTFLEQYDLRGKTILPFCTHEGSGMGHSEADIKALCADAKVGKGLAITGNKVNQAKKDIENWLKKAEIL